MLSTIVIPFETTWHVRHACLCLHTQRAARALARRSVEALRPAGLANRQFSLLIALTAEGRTRLAAALPFWARMHDTLEAELEGADADG